MGCLSNSGQDENGGIAGGQAGDQGGEWTLIGWYSRPWNCILRHPDTSVRAKLSYLGAAAAKNDKIGYDQGQRTTYWEELKKVGYDPAKITTACEADCSAGVCSNVKAAGYLLNIPALQNIQILATPSMRVEFKNAGFEVLTDSKYLNSDANLVAGDILLNDACHTAMWVDENVGTAGSNAGGTVISSLGIGSYEYKDYTVKEGDTIHSIAKKYGCTPAMIMFINNLDSSELKVGTKLKIPVSKGGYDSPADGTKPIIKKHTHGIKIYRPVIEAIFFTENGMLSAVSTTGVKKDEDLDKDIISVNTTRDMSQDCATFRMTLVWRNNWYTNLSSNDLVIIKMQRPPETKDCVFFGLIDDIRKVTDFSSGQPQRAVQVTGRGFNKALVNFDVGLLENISIDLGTGFFSDLVNLASLDSYDAIELVLKNYIGRAINYKFADGTTFEDRYTYTGNHHEGEVLTDYQSYTNYNGSLWNFIKELSNPPFNETYWEVLDSKATLTHRRTPFDKEDWIELDRVTIQDIDIVSDNTGRSDLETYTLYAVNSVLGSQTLVNIYMPLWYPPFVDKYGISQLTASTSYQSWGYSDGVGISIGGGVQVSPQDAQKYANSDYVCHAFIHVMKQRGYTEPAMKGILSYAIQEGAGLGTFTYESYWVFGPISGKPNDLTLDNDKWLKYCESGYYPHSANPLAFGIGFLADSNTPDARGASKMINQATSDGYYWQDPQWQVQYLLTSLESRTSDSDFKDPKTFNGSAEEYCRRVTAFYGMPGWTWDTNNYYMEEHLKHLRNGNVDKAWNSYGSDFQLVTFGKYKASSSNIDASSTGSSSTSSASSSSGTGDVESIKRFYTELFNWNIKNNIFTNGSLTVTGKAQYKIGTRVITESSNMEYYVESVSHNFNCYGSWTTDLGVTRGIEPQERFTPPWGCYEEMTPATLNAIILRTSGEVIDWTNLPKVDIVVGGGGVSGAATSKQQKMIASAKKGSMFGCAGGWCLAWVQCVYEDAFGSRTHKYCCAGTACTNERVSTSKTGIPAGAAIYGKSNPTVYCGGHDAGHVAIYVDDNTVIGNEGGSAPKVRTLSDWISAFGYNGWGWTFSDDLTK